MYADGLDVPAVFVHTDDFVTIGWMELVTYCTRNVDCMSIVDVEECAIKVAGYLDELRPNARIQLMNDVIDEDDVGFTNREGGQ